MSDPSPDTTEAYIVRLWQRGLLSNGEAVRALVSHCAALNARQQRLLAACRRAEPVVAQWTQCHPEATSGQRAWAALREALEA